MSVAPGLTTFAVTPISARLTAAGIRSTAPLLAPYGRFPAVSLWAPVACLLSSPINDDQDEAGWRPPRVGERRTQTILRSVAHRVSSCLLESCNLRNTAETCDSTVLTEMDNRVATCL